MKIAFISLMFVSFHEVPSASSIRVDKNQVVEGLITYVNGETGSVLLKI